MDSNERRSVVTRSPGYPMIDLKEAIKRTMILWDKDRTNFIPTEVAFSHLGYKSRGGYAARVIAALKQFELITEKKGDVKLTQWAVDLAIYDHASGEYREIIRKIALKPDIFARIFNDYNGTLPSDNNLKVRLIKDYKFNPKSVDEFIGTFKQTIEFAGLNKTQSTEQPEEMDASAGERLSENRAEQAKPTKLESALLSAQKVAIMSYNIPLKNKKTATLSFDNYPSKEDLTLLRKWLEILELSLPDAMEEGVSVQQ